MVRVTIDTVRDRDRARTSLAHQGRDGLAVIGARADVTIRQPQIDAPARAEHRTRRFGLLHPYVNRTVAAHLACGQIAETD